MNFLKKLFKSDKGVQPANSAQPVNLTAITRTEIVEGISIPGIIQNGQYHFTDIQVYSDGLINCWGMVDLPMFKDKINNNWVITTIPDGAAISIYSLGNWVIDKGEWTYTKISFYFYVRSLIKRLNPTLENLQNYNGSDIKLIGKARISKHFMPSPKPYYYENPNFILSKKVSGEKFYIFFRNDDGKMYLAELSIYKSGLIEITHLPEKKSFQFNELKGLIGNGRLVTELKKGELVTVLGLGSFIVKSGHGIDIKFKYNEFVDKYNELNGEEDSIKKCARIFGEYKQTPTKKLKQDLKAAYEVVPEHQRIFVGTMDTKDYEVRQVIYGDIIKREWEEEYGYEYPYDDMPNPTDG